MVEDELIESRIEKKNFRIKRIVATITVLFVPLSIYAFGNKGLTLGDLALLFALFLVFIDQIKNKRALKLVLPLIIYVFIIMMLSFCHWIFGIEMISDGVLSLLRYAVYIVYCATISRDYIDFETFFRIYKRFALFFAIYLILQFLFYYLFHIILPSNPLSSLGLEVTNGVLWYNDVSRYASGVVMYRPCSFFIEPAHYAVFQVPLLYLLIKKYSGGKKDFLAILLIIVSILLSGSTTGIIVIVFCLIKKILTFMKKNIIIALLMIIACIFAGLAFMNTGYGEKVIGRIFIDESYGAVQGRFGNIDEKYEDVVSKHPFIGNGMGNEMVGYVPSFPRLFIVYGVIGFVTLACVLVYSFMECNKTGREMIILLLIVSLGTLTLFGINIVLYFVIIYSNYKKEKNYDTA